MIKICEDTEVDGRADKFTIFGESLNIPSSRVFANGGLIVSQAPYFLFLEDTDGDDRADVRKILFDGWNTWDTHAGPSNLKYALDNKIWGTVGYCGFEGNINGRPMKFDRGLYNFLPDGTEFELLAHTTNNTWGRSEEHTSELQSLMRISYDCFCLKKKKQIQLTVPT